MSAFYYENIPQLAIDLIAEKTIFSHGFNNDPEELGKLLHSLNVKALVQRYGDNEEQYTYEHEERTPSSPIEKDLMIALFHRLSCYLYQCSEGDVTEMWQYKTLREVQNSIAYRLVSDYMKPEFEWGE